MRIWIKNDLYIVDRAVGDYIISLEDTVNQLISDEIHQMRADKPPIQKRKPIKIYVSHPIRGTGGDLATEGEINHNIEKAKKTAKDIREAARNQKVDFEFYVPAEQDEFPQLAMKLGLLDVEDVLCIDGNIIKTCDGVLFLDYDGLSSGMEFEKQIATENAIPWVDVVPDSILSWESVLHMLVNLI